MSDAFIPTPPPYLSPSSMGTFNQCPQKFKFNKIDLIQDDPTEATLMGNFVHEVLESFYAVSPELRDLPLLKRFAGTVWDESGWMDRVTPWLRDPEKIRLFRWNSWWCMENIFKVEDPTSVNASYIEYELNGELSGVMLKGFIDRFTVSEETVTISDYKTGKTPKKHYVGDKFLQLKIYATLAEAIGLPTTKTLELLYLKDGVAFRIPFTDDDRQEVVNYVTSTKRNIDAACETGDFPTNRSILCDWCSYKKICPAWNKKER